MPKSSFILICLLAMLALPASAQNMNQEGRKSTAAARWHSYGWTLGPVVAGGVLMTLGLTSDSPGRETSGVVGGLTVAGLGVVVGPIIGQNYAGRRWRTPGMTFRIVGLISGGLGALLAASVDQMYSLDPYETSGDTEVAIVLITAGVVCELTAAVIDIATLGRSVDEYNRRNESGQLSVAPTFDFADKTFGLTAAFRF